MFKCGKCGLITKSGEKMTKIVIETRRRALDGREETVKEMGVCEVCVKELEKNKSGGDK